MKYRLWMKPNKHCLFRQIRWIWENRAVWWIQYNTNNRIWRTNRAGAAQQIASWCEAAKEALAGCLLEYTGRIEVVRQKTNQCISLWQSRGHSTKSTSKVAMDWLTSYSVKILIYLFTHADAGLSSWPTGWSGLPLNPAINRQAVIKIHVEIIVYFVMISFIVKDSLNMRYFVKDSLNRERKLGLYVTGIS